MTDQITTSDRTWQIAIKKFNDSLAPILDAATIHITDQRTLVESANAKLSLETYQKSVKNFFAAELGPLEERVKRLKNDQASLISPAKMALDGLVERQRSWMAEEKRKAELERQREQQRLEAEQRAKAEAERKEAERIAAIERKRREAEIETQRKSGEVKAREAERLKKEAAAQEARDRELAAKQAIETTAAVPVVRVAPSIPTVAGVRNQTYFGGEIKGGSEPEKEANRQRIIGRFLSGDPVTRQFLLQFITVNEAEIGRYARETKDVAVFNAALPECLGWSKG